MAEDPQKLSLAGKLASAFIESRLTVMLVLAVLLVGTAALLVTPREYNPQIVVPAANIIVARPGASPEEVHNLVVKPLEAIMSSMSGLNHTYGYATYDLGVVTVEFEVGEDLERSLVKLYDHIMSNMDRMPPGTVEPLVKQINADDVPVLTLNLSSSSLDQSQLYEVAERVLEQLRNVPGVSTSALLGGQPRTLHVWIDPQRLAAHGLSLDQLTQALQGANAALAADRLVQGDRDIPLRTNAFLRDAASVGAVVVGVHQGQPVFLRDVARVDDGPAEPEQMVRHADGPAAAGGASREEQPAVSIAMAKKPGTNAVVVTRAIQEKLALLERSMIPAEVRVNVIRDDGARADDAVDTLVEHLAIAIGAVVVILLVFLGWREAGIVTLTVPLILFVVLAVGLLFGQSINRITLFALILSLGLLVDDSIVVIENIHRHFQQRGDRPLKDLFVQATNEIGKPTNIATIAVIAAFIPMAFVTGMMGPFMGPIPFNVPVAMLTSLAVAYTVVPWAAYHWLSGKAAHHSGDAQAAASTRMQRVYAGWVGGLLRHRGRRYLFFGVVGLLLIAALLQPAWQFLRPQGLSGPPSPLGVELKMLPNDNTNSLLVQVDMPAGTHLTLTDQVARAVGEVLRQMPEVLAYESHVGEAAPVDFAALVRGDLLKRGANLAQLRINLRDKHVREQSSHAFANDLDGALQAVRTAYPQARIKIYETPPGPPVRAQILAELYGPDYERLRMAAGQIRKDFGQVYGMINADDSVSADVMAYRVTVDREKAALAGVSPAELARMLQSYVAGFSLGTLHVDDARSPTDIVVRLPASLRGYAETIAALPVSNRQGQQMSLQSLANIETIRLAKPILTRDQHPLVTVSGELIRSSPVVAVLSLDKLLDGKTFQTGNLGFVEAQPQDLTGYSLLWGGEMRLTLDVFRDLGSAFMVALAFIYLLLMGYYKSFVMPMIVMGAIPLTMIGVFPGHWLTGQAFTATSMIGVIALAGIVVRNSLLLIDFILDQRAKGHVLEDAVIQAGLMRFRPILLTALAIILGSAIMITDPVFGGLAVSLIFGTFASTALTLVVIPVVYYRWQRRAGT